MRFFHLFFNFDFWAVREVKVQKVSQNEKWQLHPLCAISQEQYSIWSSFLVHLCKMMMSLDIVSVFSKFWFFRLLGGWKGKKWSKMTKNSVCHAQYLGNHISYECHLWYTFVKWYLHVFFSFFQNVDFLVSWGENRQKTVQNNKKFYLSCFKSQEIDCHLCCTCVKW